MLVSHLANTQCHKSLRAIKTGKKQQGVALITVLMIFAIVTIMAADTTARMGMDIKKTSYFLQNAQAQELALSGEALARQVLFIDYEESGEGNEKTDHLESLWAQDIPPMSLASGVVAMGSEDKKDNSRPQAPKKLSEKEQQQLEAAFNESEVQVKILDLHNRFNINHLVDDEGKIVPEQLLLFKELMRKNEIDEKVADNIADWVDSDQLPTGYYSEDTAYLNSSPGYRAANQKIDHLSELFAIAEVDRETFIKLAPLVTALPETITYNLNTLAPDFLAVIDPKLDPEAFKTKREELEEGFKTLEEFLELEMLAGHEFDATQLGVASEYFEIWVLARFLEQEMMLRATVHRSPTSGQIVLLHRSYGKPMFANDLNPFTLDSQDDEEQDPNNPDAEKNQRGFGNLSRQLPKS